jgi:hypothetical protein
LPERLNSLFIPFSSEIGQTDLVPGKLNPLSLREEIYEAFIFSDRPVVFPFLEILFGKLKLTVGIEWNSLAGIRVDREKANARDQSGYKPY